MDIQRWDRAKEKIGNTFELTVLIQKRVRELVRERQKPLVTLEHRNPIQIALEEVLQDKIYLAPPPAMDLDDDFGAPAPAVVAAKTSAVGASDDPTAAPARSASSSIDSEKLDDDEDED